MNEIKTVKTTTNIGHDIWFNGAADKTAAGGDTYFICEHLNRNYLDPDTGEFYTFCSHKRFRVDDSSAVCNMDCDEYGKCDTCAGFSAVRCQECEIPRP